MSLYSTAVQYRTGVTVETIDTMLVNFRRKNSEKVGKLRAPWKIMSMKITSTGLYLIKSSKKGRSRKRRNSSI